MRTFLLGTHLFAIAVFLSLHVKSPVTFVIQKTLCLDSPTYLDDYVTAKGSLGEKFYYKDLDLAVLITQSSCLHSASVIIKTFYYPTKAQYIICKYN